MYMCVCLFSAYTELIQIVIVLIKLGECFDFQNHFGIRIRELSLQVNILLLNSLILMNWKVYTLFRMFRILPPDMVRVSSSICKKLALNSK